MTEVKRDIYQEAIDLWGYDIQIVIAIEELSELIKELCKFQRYGMDVNFDSDNLIEEIADVQIMINQMKVVFGKNRYYELKGDKIMNLLTRMDRTRQKRKSSKQLTTK